MTKILLVEDDKSLREIYGVRLLAEGYDIISAGDGEEALAMAIKDRPALIVSDVMMPKISGFDMLDILRSTTETKNIKVIMMTALSSDDQRERGVSLGADRYLVKSQVGIEDVVRTVHEVLGDAPTSSSPPLTASATVSAPSRPLPPPASAATAPMMQEQQGLPQPTAPFSTARPASLGDRIINPPPKAEQQRDFSDLMNEELASIGVAPVAPAPTPQHPVSATPPTPAPAAPPAQPEQPAPAPAPETSYEETPLPPSSAQQPGHSVTPPSAPSQPPASPAPSSPPTQPPQPQQ